MSAEILSALKRIEAKLDAVLAKRQSEERRQPAPSAENVAPDSDLDSKYGDPKVRFDPRDWNGESMKNRSYSQCPPEFLEMMANALEYFAQKKAATEPTKAGYDRKDAARARGWARRAPTDRKPAAQPQSGGNYDFDGDTGGGGGFDSEGHDDSGIPF